RHRRRQTGDGASGQDQPRVRPRQQSHGRDGQRESGVLRDGCERHGSGRSGVSGMAFAPADASGERAGELPPAPRYTHVSQGLDQSLLRSRSSLVRSQKGRSMPAKKFAADSSSTPEKHSAETRRLDEDARRERNWKRWGPYLAERQWGTV